MPEKPAVTSSELGVLWLTYQEKTMILQMLEHFIAHADDDQSRSILTDLSLEIEPYVEQIATIFRNEGAVVPVGFTSQDVKKNVPKLYENGFDIMFFLLMNELSMGLHALHITMSYREDLVVLLKDLTAVTQQFFNRCTQYLLEKGILARPPYVPMPKTVEFVEGNKYLSGLNPFSEKRTLNTIEGAHLFHAIETNITGMKLLSGFAQTAENEEVRKYFREGAELAKSIIKEFNETLLQSGIQASAASAGNVTRSNMAPFSDKLMMYCTSLLCSFSFGGTALGSAFCLRSDLPAKVTVFAKDIFEYAQAGAKIMIRNGWMEEPPQMREQEQLVTH